MKVVVAHNRYRSDVPSGENGAVDADVSLLRDAGHDVVTLIKESDSIDAGPMALARAAAGPVYASPGVSELERLLVAERPDVVHVHNVMPLISPWVVRTARSHGVPVVQTVHNYRHGCLNGQHFRDGHVCEICSAKRLKVAGVRHGCYRGSRAQSLAAATGAAFHWRTWRDELAGLIALTPFMQAKLVNEGFAESRIHLRPSWVPDPGEPDPVPPSGDLLFVGRLDVNKGVGLLLDAWRDGGRASGRRLRVVGDGELADRVRAEAATDPTIHFDGRLERDQVDLAMRTSAVVVVPSLWFEGYPMVVAEAFARGRAVLTVTGGAVASIVGSSYGWAAEPTSGSLAAAIAAIGDDDAARRGAAARAGYLHTGSPARALERLEQVYREVTR